MIEFNPNVWINPEQVCSAIVTGTTLELSLSNSESHERKCESEAEANAWLLEIIKHA